MKARMISSVSLFVLLFPSIAMHAWAQTPQQTLQQYVADLQRNPNDDALREKVIALAQTMKPTPPISDEARMRMDFGIAAVEGAKDEVGFRAASAEFAKAANLAPWLGDAYRNLAIAQDKSSEYAPALKSLHFYLLTAPSASDESWAKSMTNKVGYRSYEQGQKVRAEMMLRLAIKENDAAGVRQWIGTGAVAKDAAKNAWLIMCGQRNDLFGADVARVLLDSGADVDATEDCRRSWDSPYCEETGKTILMFAAEYWRTDVVQLLIERHADVNARSGCGTALIYVDHFTSIGFTEAERQQSQLHKQEVIRILKDAGAHE